MARPTVIQNKSLDSAQTTLPATNRHNPASTTGRRPKRSEASPKGICMKACVRPYIPMAKPILAGSLPPASPTAATAKTGNSKNKPSMRAANSPARAILARRSVGVSDKEGVWDIKRLVQRVKSNPTLKAQARYSTKLPSRNVSWTKSASGVPAPTTSRTCLLTCRAISWWS